MAHLKEALRRGDDLTVPTPVIAEVWRGGSRSARTSALLRSCIVEPLFEDLARLAGEAIAAIRGASVVDAIVMSSAARRGDRVVTADFDDLERLRGFFPGVRLLVV
jgi:hypothetical protein